MLCTELPTLENGKAVAEEAPGGQQGVALTYTIRPNATWGDGTPITTRDVQFTWEVGRHPKSGVGNAEMYRRFWQLDLIDDKTFTLHDEKLGFNYNAINDFRLLPEHLERPVFEADPATYRNRTLFDTDPTNPGLAFGPYRIAQDRARQPDPARAQPDLVGRATRLRPHRDQGDREHDGPRGQSALRRGRDGRGLRRPVPRPGPGLRASAWRPVPGLLQAGPGLRAHGRDARQSGAGRCARPPGAALRPRPPSDQRAAVRRTPAGGRHHGPSAGLGAYRTTSDTTRSTRARPPPCSTRPAGGWAPMACGTTRPAPPCASS